MQYKNTKTGVVFDSPCIISGGDWVEVVEKPTLEEKQPDVENEEPQEELVQETEVQDSSEDEEVTTNPALKDIKKADIMQELDAFGVEYDKRANKQVLYDLMMEQGKE